MWLQPLLGPSLLAACLGFPAALSFSLYKEQQLQFLDSSVWEVFFLFQIHRGNIIQFYNVVTDRSSKFVSLILFTNHIYIAKYLQTFTYLFQILAVPFIYLRIAL